MTRLADLARIRSKNAGPFWLTIDLFCHDRAGWQRLQRDLPDTAVARALGADPATLRRFDLPDLLVVKYSLPRPQVQGSLHDRDMHGASFAEILKELELPAAQARP